MYTTSTRIALFAALVGSVYAQLSAAFVGQLRDAPTASQRLALLKDEDVSAYVFSVCRRLRSQQPPQLAFDFLGATTGVVTGAGGHTVSASSANFPAVIGNGISMSMSQFVPQPIKRV